MSARRGGAAATAVAVGTDRVRLRLAAGAPLEPTFAVTPRLARALTVARAVGAPLLPAVDAAAAAEDDALRATRAVAVATAQARAVAGGLVVAPLVLVPALGRLAGADVVGFYGSAPGRIVLVAGLALLGLGAAVARGLVRRVGRPPAGAEAEEAVELVATALIGGSGHAAALRLVAEVLPATAAGLRRLALDLDLGVDLDGSDPVSPAAGDAAALARLGPLLTEASRLGAPSAVVLRRLAADLRAAELAQVLAAAERLPAQLSVPTTLLLLPATLLLVGAPLLDAGLRGLAP